MAQVVNARPDMLGPSARPGGDLPERMVHVARWQRPAAGQREEPRSTTALPALGVGASRGGDLVGVLAQHGGGRRMERHQPGVAAANPGPYSANGPDNTTRFGVLAGTVMIISFSTNSEKNRRSAALRYANKITRRPCLPRERHTRRHNPGRGITEAMPTSA